MWGTTGDPRNRSDSWPRLLLSDATFQGRVHSPVAYRALRSELATGLLSAPPPLQTVRQLHLPEVAPFAENLNALHQHAVPAVVAFFFFQAEDGIRDVAVTGVQTCALPISVDEDSANENEEGDEEHFAQLERERRIGEHVNRKNLRISRLETEGQLCAST